MNLTADNSKKNQIADLLEGKIRAGEIKPNTRLLSIRSLAEQFAVSNKVVELALNLLAEKGLVDKHVGRGTFVKNKLPIQKEKKIKKIAVITYYSNEMFDCYFDSLKEELDSANCILLYARYCLEKYELSDKSLDNVLSMEPDAFIIDEPVISTYHRLKSRLNGKPHCLVHEQQKITDFDCPAFFIDKISMYTNGLNYLFEQNHKRILTLGFNFLSTLEASSVMTNEYKLFNEGAARLGLELNHFKIPYVGAGIIREDIERLMELLTSPTPPTAIFGLSDRIVYSFVNSLKKHFPEHPIRECLGVYNTPWSNQPEQEFHTFNMNFNSMWREAIQYLISPHANEKIVSWIQPSLLIRNQPTGY